MGTHISPLLALSFCQLHIYFFFALYNVLVILVLFTEQAHRLQAVILSALNR